MCSRFTAGVKRRILVVPILIAGETPLTLGLAETKTEKEKSRGSPAFTFTPLLDLQLLLFDLLFQMLRAGLCGGLLTVKSVLLIDRIGEHDGATLSVDHLHAGRIV